MLVVQSSFKQTDVFHKHARIDAAASAGHARSDNTGCREVVSPIDIPSMTSANIKCNTAHNAQ